MCTRFLIELSLFVTLAGVSTAQDEVGWQYGYAYAPKPALRPVTLAPTPDGGVLVVSVGWTPPATYGAETEIVVVQLDENGDQVWSAAEVSPPDNGLYLAAPNVDATVDAAGNAYVVFSGPIRSHLLSFDPAGTLRWRLQLTAPNGDLGYHASHLALGPNGDLVVAGAWYESLWPRIGLHALDASGATLWTWSSLGIGSLGNGATGAVRGVTRGLAGEVYVYGQSDYFQGYADNAQIHAVDAQGQFLWRRVLGLLTPLHAYGADAAIDGAGNLYVLSIEEGTEMLLTSLTPAGVPRFVLDSVAFAGGHDALCHGVLADAGGSVFVIGARNPVPWITTGIEEPTLLRYDTAGNYLGWSRPSVVAPGTAGATLAGAFDPAGNLLVTGWSEHPTEQVFVASFRPDGSERWARRCAGVAPRYDFVGYERVPGGAVDLAVVFDPRGNAFVSSQYVTQGSGLGEETGVRTTKRIEGGPLGVLVCSPAAVNSTGRSASARAVGSVNASDDNVTVLLTDLPAGSFTFLLASRTTGNVPGVGGGQGTLCLGGAIGRYVGAGQIRRARPDGSASLQLHLDAVPQPTGLVAATAGETWTLQAWYRDANPGVTSNLTDAVSVLLQ